MHSHQLTEAEHVKNFLFAGRARFTLVSPVTGNRFTYQVNKIKDGDGWFVGLLTGPDNVNSYSYMGLITKKGDLLITRKSCVSNDAASYKALNFVLQHLKNDRLLVEFWHEGRCGKCNRTLTVPESIARGLGPDCASQMGLA